MSLQLVTTPPPEAAGVRREAEAAGARTPTCRDCGRALLFIQMAGQDGRPTGSRMPCDPTARYGDGTRHLVERVVIDEGRSTVGRLVLRAGEATLGYEPHHGTCPERIRKAAMKAYSPTLFDGAPATTEPPAPATAPCPAAPPPPAAVGDTVHVPHAVCLPSGSKIRRGHYTVLRVEYCTTREAWRLVVETALDTSALDKRYRPPTREAIEAAIRAGEPPPPVPIAAQVKRIYLDLGEWTRYDPQTTDGRHPATISDRP